MSLRALWLGIALIPLLGLGLVSYAPSLRAWRAHARVRTGMDVEKVFRVIRDPGNFWVFAELEPGSETYAHISESSSGEAFHAVRDVTGREPTLTCFPSLAALLAAVRADPATYGCITSAVFSYAGPTVYELRLEFDATGRVTSSEVYDYRF